MDIKDIISDIYNEDDYIALTSFSEQNLYETYVIMGELLNPNYAYPYTGDKGWYHYTDNDNNRYFVRLTYNPTKTPYYELKTGWYDDNSKPNYDPPTHPNTTTTDWDKRSDTVAKIFRDEILPLFLSKKLDVSVIKIIPITMSRYQFSIRMVNKFVDTDKIEIIENKPKEIILKLK